MLISGVPLVRFGSPMTRGHSKKDFLVLYGDSWVDVDPVEVLRAARDRHAPALMTVFRNDGRWDGSNVVLEVHAWFVT